MQKELLNLSPIKPYREQQIAAEFADSLVYIIRRRYGLKDDSQVREKFQSLLANNPRRILQIASHVRFKREPLLGKSTARQKSLMRFKFVSMGELEDAVFPTPSSIIYRVNAAINASPTSDYRHPTAPISDAQIVSKLVTP